MTAASLNKFAVSAISDNVQIMVINIDAFRRSFNIIHRPNDRLNGLRPIELIRETNPIVIIDEPQSVDTTPKAKEAIRSLNHCVPLGTQLLMWKTQPCLQIRRCRQL